jgi:hypothetical protein
LSTTLPDSKIYKTREPSRYALRILYALNAWPHIYAGTVPAAEIRRRRAANKQARKSRRVNRGK